MSDLPLTPAQLTLEQTGLEFLRIGKFRKARDAFKLLHKTHPARALPLLIDANLGLAQEMMAKGLVSEADQVLAYLKTIVPADFDLAAKVATASVASGPRDAWSSTVPLAVLRLAAADTKPSALIRCADEIILGATSPDHPGHPDAHAILTALELGYASEHTAETSRLLRSVPRSSPFSHWVLFFKGMTALEAGARLRAADCFRRVPKDSLLQPAIATLLIVSGAATTPQPAPRAVHGLCAWAGLPAIGEPLLEADKLWRKRQYSKAFGLLVKKLPGLFCFGARSYYSDLTRLLSWKFTDCSRLPNNYCDTVLTYTSDGRNREVSATFGVGFFSIEFQKFEANAHSHFQNAVMHLESLEQCFPLSAATRSQVFTQVAVGYLTAFSENFRDHCSASMAKKALERALLDDPGNLRASLKLCDLLAKGQDTSAYHRFLDDLAKRYPTNKEVLIRTGECCNGRKVFTKALRNFENAAKIDLIDPRITHGLLRARLGIADEAYKKGTPAKANWDLIDALASPDKSCPTGSLWRLRVRRIFLEVSRRAERSEVFALIAAAQPLAPSAFQFENACQFSGLKYLPQLRTFFPTPAAPESFADVLTLVDEINAREGAKDYHTARVIGQGIFFKHQQLLLGLVTGRKDLISLLIRIFSAAKPQVELVGFLIEREYRLDPKDLLLVFLHQSYSYLWLKPSQQSYPADFYPELRDLSELTDPDTRRLVHLMRKIALRAETFYDRQPTKVDLDRDYSRGNYGFDDDDDDDDFFDDDEDDDDDDEDVPHLSDEEFKKKIEEISRAIAAFVEPAKRPPSKPRRS